MIPIIDNNIEALIAAFKKNDVEKVYAFGSVTSAHFTNTSDVDFLISFNKTLTPLQKGENWFSLYYSLKQILQRDIDLVREEDIKNPILLQTIDANKQLIYG
jgi:uncharacterized protein